MGQMNWPFRPEPSLRPGGGGWRRPRSRPRPCPVSLSLLTRPILVLFFAVLAGPVTPARAVEPPEPRLLPPPALLAQARAQVEALDFEGASRTLNTLLARFPDATERPEALLLYGRARLELGDLGQAARQLEALIQAHPEDAHVGVGWLLLGRVRWAAGDIAGAEAAWLRVGEVSPELAGIAARERAELQLGQGKTDEGAALLAAAIPTLPTALRQPTRARLAEVLRAAGQAEAALVAWQEFGRNSTLRVERAQAELEQAKIEAELGRTQAALSRLLGLVTASYDLSPAAEALDRLDALGVAIPPYQRGFVAYYRRRWADVIRFLEPALPGLGGTRLAEACYYLADAYLYTGRPAEARAYYLKSYEADPTGPWAEVAIWDLARVEERYGDPDRALAYYRRLAENLPESNRGQAARFHLGLAAYRQGRTDLAAAHWEMLADRTGLAGYQARFWLGKLALRQGRTEEAARRWAPLLDGLPGTLGEAVYYQVRAREILAGTVPTGRPYRPVPPVGLNPSGGGEEGPFPADFKTGLLLWKAGFADDARRIVRGLIWAVDPELGSRLGTLLVEAGLYSDGVSMLTVAAGKSGRVPAGTERAFYPLPFAGLVEASARRFNIDPLLLYALIRQESRYDPRAVSPAQARGLTQVIPPTARDIAARLGYKDFDVEQLFRPAISIEFGAYYLSAQLSRFDNLWLGLAAYNGGPGNAQRWRDQFGVEDPDLFVELIPVRETQAYVRLVYGFYGAYRQVYRP